MCVERQSSGSFGLYFNTVLNNLYIFQLPNNRHEYAPDEMIVFENRHVDVLFQVSKAGISNVAAQARSSVGSPFHPVDISFGLCEANDQRNIVSRLVFI